MAKVKVRRYIRDGKYVTGYSRKKRPKSKKRILAKKPVKLIPVRDAYGRVMGFRRVKKK